MACVSHIGQSHDCSYTSLLSIHAVSHAQVNTWPRKFSSFCLNAVLIEAARINDSRFTPAGGYRKGDYGTALLGSTVPLVSFKIILSGARLVAVDTSKSDE